MKIAFICTEKLPVPPVAGGAIQLYIEGILPYLSSQHDITVFSVDHPSLAKDETVNNVRYIRVSGKNPLRYVKNIKEMLDESFDLIHVFNRPRWILDFCENLPNTKFSLSLHNEMFLPDKIPEDKAIECINRVEFINTVSKFVADGVKNLYPIAENKLNVVYSGVDTNIYKPYGSQEAITNRNLLKQKYNISANKIVLHVTRLSPKKGTHIVLGAMKKVMESHKDVALVIVGSKWYGKNEVDEFTRQCQTLASSLEGPVIFTGFIPPSDIPAHYCLGDIFLCASQWDEPLARIHYEAMAAGLPIITTDRGGNAEIFEQHKNGIVIKDYNNPYSFADHINYLLSNSHEAYKMGTAARLEAERYYNWERVASQVLAPLNHESIKSSTIAIKHIMRSNKENDFTDLEFFNFNDF